MTSKKIELGLLFGGRSNEHEISLQSAKSIYAALDKNKYAITLISIDKKGTWRLQPNHFLAENNNPFQTIDLHSEEPIVCLSPGDKQGQLINLKTGKTVASLDLIFPILHGPFGEDGTVQGLLKLIGVPFVGSGVLSSALCMDKDTTKRLLQHAGLPVSDWICLSRHQFEKFSETSGLKEILSYPRFVKPANMGSSIGISKVEDPSQLYPAIKEAFKYDDKILIEEAIVGRELECAVLGNAEPKVSLPGEFITEHNFYSYAAKYEDNTLKLIPSADLPEEIIEEIQLLALAAFNALGCAGMARVDFFLQKNGQLFINEINTIPGFTEQSLYPLMWEASGLKYSDLLNELIRLALEKS